MKLRSVTITLLSLGAGLAVLSIVTDLPTSAEGIVQSPPKSNSFKDILAVPNSSARANSSDYRSGESAVRSFLSDKKSFQDIRAAALKSRGVDGDADKLRALFDRANIDPARPPRSMSAEALRELNEAFKTEVVQLLMAVGIDASTAVRMIGLGLDPIKAAADHIRGSSTPLQELILSDQVLLATPGKRLSQDLSDGFRSTLTAEVQRILSGEAVKTVQFRQHSGTDGTGITRTVSSDIDPDSGQLYLFGFSRGYYQQLAAEYQLSRVGSSEQLTANSANVTALLSPPYIVVGDDLIPAGNSIASGGSLQQVITDLANIKSKLAR